jgi:hypothetical protein
MIYEVVYHSLDLIIFILMFTILLFVMIIQIHALNFSIHDSYCLFVLGIKIHQHEIPTDNFCPLLHVYCNDNVHEFVTGWRYTTKYNNIFETYDITDKVSSVTVSIATIFTQNFDRPTIFIDVDTITVTPHLKSYFIDGVHVIKRLSV